MSRGYKECQWCGRSVDMSTYDMSAYRIKGGFCSAKCENEAIAAGLITRTILDLRFEIVDKKLEEEGKKLEEEEKKRQEDLKKRESLTSYSSSSNNYSSSYNNKGCFKLFFLFIFVMFVFPIVAQFFVGIIDFYKLHNQTSPQPSSPAVRQETTNSKSLSYKKSCGTITKNVSIWYRVIGDRSAYQTVKSKYCGDSFMRKDGSVQFASFNDEQEAIKFANKLKQATGYNFRIETAQKNSG